VFNFIKKLFTKKVEVIESIETPVMEKAETATPVIETAETAAPTVEKNEPEKPKKATKATDINSMTVNQLLEYAASNGIDVKKSWKKAKIVETIAAAS